MTTAAAEETTIATAADDAETAITVEERPVHLARCAECGFAARFQPNASGTGFRQHDNLGLGLGIGPNGRPTCPAAHGEMEIADDKIPAADAFALVSEQLDEARQPRLPIPTPPFNYEGVLHALFEKRHAIAVAEKKVLDRKEALKRANGELDDLQDEIGKMLDEFERSEQDRKDEAERRETQAETEAPRLVMPAACTWEAAHPGQACPICSEEASPVYLERILGLSPASTDALAHIEDVETVQLAIHVERTVEALENVDTFVAETEVRGWSSEERDAIIAWAEAEHDRLAGLPVGSDVYQRPALLGTSHTPAELSPEGKADGDPQICMICEKPLPKREDIGDYKVTDLVGTTCSGKAPNRYPETGKKKPAKKGKAAK